jgi:hypothetical protein
MPDAAQPTTETDEKKSRGLGSYVLWAFAAVMVYVLSSGPMWWLVDRRKINPHLYRTARAIVPKRFYDFSFFFYSLHRTRGHGRC